MPGRQRGSSLAITRQTPPAADAPPAQGAGAAAHKTGRGVKENHEPAVPFVVVVRVVLDAAREFHQLQRWRW